MKRTAKSKKLPGLYMRGDVWWFTYRLGSKKHFHSLGTADYGQAVQKALEIRKTPTLEPAAVFLAEIDAFVAHKLAWNGYSPASAYHKKYALRAFAKATTRANPASVTTAFRAFLAAYGLPEPFMAHPEIKHGVSIYRWDLRRVFSTHVGAGMSLGDAARHAAYLRVAPGLGGREHLQNIEVAGRRRAGRAEALREVAAR